MKSIEILVKLNFTPDGTIVYTIVERTGTTEGVIPIKKDPMADKMKFSCARYKRKVNEIPAPSCHRCTHQCRLKGICEGTVIEV